MGLESSEELRAFCLELSSEQPSPGGGTASAAAGAMAASLLVMVCGITSRSKKHEASKPELDKLKDTLKQLRDELVRLAAEDAASYDQVVTAMRKRKDNPGEKAEAAVQDAFTKAAQVPLSTASQCQRVLELAVRVAELGSMSASSDTGVATLLADAGFRGAAMNVRINARYISDKRLVQALEESLTGMETKARGDAGKALAALEKG